MENGPKINKYQIALDNREIKAPQRNEEKEKKRFIFVSGSLSIIFLVIILVTLPLTVLSWSGLFVYSSIVSLVIFLFVLLLRYFSILVLAYLYITKYTVQEREGYYPFVSILVPVYNEEKVVKSSIESLLEIDYPNYEIIIINDGSSDQTSAVAETLVGYRRGRSSQVKVSLINKANSGKAKSLNAGIQYSQAQFVLCMDGDSQLSSNCLKTGMKHFTDPAVGAVAGNVKVQNRKKMLTDLQALEYLEGLNMARSAQGFVKMVNIIPGPMGIFRKSALRDAGFYSSDTFAEDADVTLKILAKGWKIEYEPNAIAFTEAPETIHQLLKQRYRWTRGILQAIRKHKKHLYNPTVNFNNSIILWAMFYESLVWPAMNIFVNLFFIMVAVFYEKSIFIFLWWVGIAILDIMAAVYCVAAEKEDFRLVPYAIIYRMVFILLIDITKAMATVEEFLGIQMSWGKLERKGMSNTTSNRVNPAAAGAATVK
jgi:poly-beta-1,6-N-acetyl-D-glucosamine synthase